MKAAEYNWQLQLKRKHHSGGAAPLAATFLVLATTGIVQAIPGSVGSIEITVGAPEEDEFDAEVNLSDWTRFPAGIRAAATELRDRGFCGSFRISYNNGELQIERIQSRVAFYWVNLGDSFKEVADHKFLWAHAPRSVVQCNRLGNRQCQFSLPVNACHTASTFRHLLYYVVCSLTIRITIAEVSKVFRNFDPNPGSKIAIKDS